MSLTSRETGILMDKMNVAFDKIGRTNSTAMPASSKNDEGLAWDVMAASHLNSRASKRKKEAVKAAQDAGLYPETPLKRAGLLIPYQGNHCVLTIKMVERKGMLDKVAFYNALLAAGVKQDVLDKAWDASTGPPNWSAEYSGAVNTTD